MNLAQNNQHKRMIQKKLTLPNPLNLTSSTSSTTSGSQTTFSDIQVNTATIGALTAGSVNVMTDLTTTSATVGQDLTVGSNIFTNSIQLNNTSDPLIITTGSQNLIINGNTQINNNLMTTNLIATNLTITTGTIGTDLTVSGILHVDTISSPSGTLNITNNSIITGTLSVSSSLQTNSLTTTTTATVGTILTVNGNAFLNGTLFNNNINAGATLNISALVVNVTGSITISGNTQTDTLNTTNGAIIGTDLQVLNDTTTLNLTVVNNATVQNTLMVDTISPNVNTLVTFTTDLQAPDLIATSNIQTSTLNATSNIQTNTLNTTSDAMIGGSVIATNNIVTGTTGVLFTNDIQPVSGTTIAMVGTINIVGHLSVSTTGTIGTNLTVNGNVITNNIISTSGNINITPVAGSITAIPNIRFNTVTLIGNPITITATNIKAIKIYIVGPFAVVGTQTVTITPDASCDGTEIFVYNNNSLAGGGTQINYPSGSITPAVGKGVQFVYMNSINVMVPFLST